MLKQIIQFFYGNCNRKDVDEGINITNELEEIRTALENTSREETEGDTTSWSKKGKLLNTSSNQEKNLSRLANGRCVALHLKQRAMIILKLTRISNISLAAKILCVSRQTITLWRERWLKTRQD